MSWRETSPKMEKVAFLAAWRANEESMAELCRRFEISRKTGYKLVQRWREEEEGALVERSRAPGKCPHATDRPIVERIVAIRREHYTWGPKKILAYLRIHHPDEHHPACSTIGEILVREGLVEETRRLKAKATPIFAPPPLAPNEVWCVDYKGHFPTLDGTRCDPLTVTDSFSRLVLCCAALSPPIAMEEVKKRFVSIFRERGMPLIIKSDNGTPFASTGLALTRLSAWWIRLGISPRRIPPGKPQQNGQHERMHRVLKEETTRPTPAGSLAGQQLRFDEFVRIYNEVRPHEALDFQTPASIYTPSPREYREPKGGPQYPEGAEVRRVSKSGYVFWRKKPHYLSSALCGEDVRLVSHDEGGVLSVIYYKELVGRIDLLAGRVLGPDAGALPRTPEFDAFRPKQ